jgi:hypothetical protein
MVFGEMNRGLDVVLLDGYLTVFCEQQRTGAIHFEGANADFDAWAALVGRDFPRGATLLRAVQSECVRDGSPFRTTPIRTLADLEDITSTWVCW